jgi:hypothetical protein
MKTKEASRAKVSGHYHSGRLSLADWVDGLIAYHDSCYREISTPTVPIRVNAVQTKRLLFNSGKAFFKGNKPA